MALMALRVPSITFLLISSIRTKYGQTAGVEIPVQKNSECNMKAAKKEKIGGGKSIFFLEKRVCACVHACRPKPCQIQHYGKIHIVKWH